MNINARQMQKMMQRMGMQQQEIDATEVIIRTAEKEITFIRPNVSKVNAMGQETWQIIGHTQERLRQTYSEDDVKMVMQQANTDKQKAEAAIKSNNGNLAAAILELSEKVTTSE